VELERAAISLMGIYAARMDLQHRARAFSSRAWRAFQCRVASFDVAEGDYAMPIWLIDWICSDQ